VKTYSSKLEAEIERLKSRLAVKCAVPGVAQCERLWAADGARIQLESVDPALAEEFPFGCDTVEHLARALLAARTALDEANTRFHEMNSPTGREIELGQQVRKLRAENRRLHEELDEAARQRWCKG